MAVITWLGGSSTDGAVAANWSGGSLPGASDTIVFDNNSTQNCIFSSSAISQVVQIQIKSTFDHQIVFGTSSHAISLQSMIIEKTAAISASTATTFAFSHSSFPFTSGGLGTYVSFILGSVELNTNTLGVFVDATSRSNVTYTFANPASSKMVMDDGVYPNVTITAQSGTAYFSMTYGTPGTTYGKVDMLNFNVSSAVEIRESSGTYYASANDGLKKFKFGGTLTIASNYFHAYKSQVEFVGTSGTLTFPAEGQTATYGTGTAFNTQFYDIIISANTAGHSVGLAAGRILSCNYLEIGEGAKFIGPATHPGAEIRSIKRPSLFGTWNFSQVADGIYSSNDSRPFMGVPQGGTGLITHTKDLLLFGNDQNALASDANLSFSNSTLHADQGVKITELADPPDHVAGTGILWVHNDAPSNLYFTDDAGNDIALTNAGSAVGGGGGITALTGNVTASGTGSVAATIANEAVTYAKMQHVSATSRVLGRITSGAGDVEELTAANIRTIANVEDGADVTDATNVKSALDGMTITSVTPALDDEILIQDTNDSDNLKTVTFSDMASTVLTGAPGTGTMVTEFVGVPSGTPSISSASWTDVSLDGTALVGSTSDGPNYAGGGTKKVYTVPADGLYFVSAAVGFSAWAGDDNTYYIARITQNSSGGSAALGATFSLTGNSDGGDINPVQYYLALSQNDQVGLAVYQNIGSTKTIYFAQFAIQRVFGV
jgi:hypothetical protein